MIYFDELIVKSDQFSRYHDADEVCESDESDANAHMFARRAIMGSKSRASRYRARRV
jgi:hypothetical protein